jgi:hypothetical protein
MNKIDEYINKQKLPQKEICQKLRKIILETFPTIKEEMKWGVPAFGDGFYIVALKDHVNLGFATRGLSEEDLALFDGGGKTTKNIEIKSLKELDQKRIIKLLKMVNQSQEK